MGMYVMVMVMYVMVMYVTVMNVMFMQVMVKSAGSGFRCDCHMLPELCIEDVM